MKRRSILPALREAAAMARQAGYLSFDLGPQFRAGSGPLVVLLHGLYASAGVFRPLRRRLEAELDASTLSFSYPPGPGIVELAERLEREIAEVGGTQNIHLVGHSLGGLVMRYYARQARRDARVVQTISLAAPFLGSRRNFLVPGRAGRDIAPGSRLLAELRAKSPPNEMIPHMTVLAEEDEMIERGAYPDYGRHVLVPRVGHNGILFEEGVMTLVVDAIRRAEQRAPSPSASL
jgi:triacylglycerol lipase